MQGVRNALCFSEFPEEDQALLTQHLCPLIVVLINSHPPSSSENLRSHRRRHPLTCHQCLFQKSLPLAVITPYSPELRQRSSQPQGHFSALLDLPVLEHPLQGRSQVIVLSLQVLQPGSLQWTSYSQFGLLRKSEVVRTMSLLDGLHFPKCLESLQPVLADGLHHQGERRLPLLLPVCCPRRRRKADGRVVVLEHLTGCNSTR